VQLVDDERPGMGQRPVDVGPVECCRIDDLGCFVNTAWLKARSGIGKRVRAIEPDAVALARTRGVDVQLPDPVVPAHHCSLAVDRAFEHEIDARGRRCVDAEPHAIVQANGSKHRFV
jgi:hypothetical protein